LTSYNLILFQGRDGCPHISDYLTVRHMMRGPAPDIDIFVVAHNAALPPDFWTRVAERPTLIFAPMPMDLPTSARGTRIMAQSSSKAEQAEWFFKADLPHPQTKLIEPDTTLDETSWGPFTVMKPNGGSNGRGVRLVRTRHLTWRHPDTWPMKDDRRGRKLVAQQFVNTGPHCRCHRVLSVLGYPVYSIVSQVGGNLELPDPAGTDEIDLNVAIQTDDRAIQLSYDEEVLSLTRSIHQKFSHLPALGVDIIREHETGRLFILEMHPGGGSWHLSSEFGLKQQRDHGLDYYGQFNALGTIAKALIDTTRAMAK
jgi:hypothetical protein